MRTHLHTALLFAGFLATQLCPLSAQSRPWYDLDTKNLRVDARLDLPLMLGPGLVAGMTLISPLSADYTHDWAEAFGEEGVRENFSLDAKRNSDILGGLSVTLPLAILTADDIDGRAREGAAHMLLYGQALSVSLALNQLTKQTVRRRRPYTYNPAAKAHMADQGDDAYYSFYSGHSSHTFAGAVAGSYLFSLSSDVHGLRAAVWGSELALAAATATLRVRAGKHYWSDIITGAAVGSAIGFGLPHLHRRDGTSIDMQWYEWAAIPTGVAAGVVLGYLLDGEQLSEAPVALMPHSVPGGAGVLATGSF
ncbi:MAG: phosphatase PAP2 family protein [Bradymonadia bacterium]